MFRHSVDPLAGGGFGLADRNPLSEPGFFGVVGHGYDLHCYSYLDLGSAICPVESQALVALSLLLKPNFLFDGHGDVQKAFCTIDPTSFVLQAFWACCLWLSVNRLHQPL